MRAASHRALADRVRGTVIGPSDATYERDRQIWNARFDRRPAAIVFVAGVDDVAATLAFAVDNGLTLTVRAGGHSPAGWSSIEGGIVVDLRRLNKIVVDADGHVSVGGGTIVANLIRRLDRSGLVLPVGTCSTVGIGGLTLSGGLGYLNGSLGLTCDALRRAELVLSDGRVVTASQHEEPDLFWALRGAGASFGVVTRMEFTATRMSVGFGGAVAFRHRPLSQILCSFRDLCLTARDELGLELRIIGGGNETVAIVSAFWAGHPQNGKHALAPLGRLGDPDAGAFAAMRYARIATLDDGEAQRFANHLRSANFDELDDNILQSIARAHDDGPNGFMTILHWRHGEATRRACDACAYPHRQPAFEITFMSCWNPRRAAPDSHIHVDDVWAAVRGAGRPVYVGMVDSDESYRPEAHYGKNLERLLVAKGVYDRRNSIGPRMNDAARGGTGAV